MTDVKLASRMPPTARVGTALLACTLVLLPLPSHAQAGSKEEKAGYDRAARATVLHVANVYLTADATAQKTSEVNPGHEVVVVERSGPWIRVFANTDVKDDEGDDKPELGEEEAVTPSSGWIRDKGVVSPGTPNGDTILFGSAANFEDEAAQPHAPKNAPAAAHLLYRRVAEYFPHSNLAPEALWRAADVRWQIDRRDLSTLPSAKEGDASSRPQIYDGEMRRIMKLYPGSKVAALAAYAMLDNKLCGDWQGLPKCPEMEAGLYERYAKQFPDSPRTAEALYNAVYREGTVVTMYTVEEDRKRATAAAARTQALAADLKARFPQSDFAFRGESLAFRVAQGIAIYGTDRD